ncbi:unnamed protein product [Medioppia subpectinata]|uniref:Uncharacterized protein n=1 Tax=Medioppia subpectinata TaxID=1979941 RepID=A0A7R9L5B0_9ACAR|nr:unnamed protein product [Medioppia subpectinata]CAG2115609.1 unnamed protein product [Medioppia subpectinata]
MQYLSLLIMTAMDNNPMRRLSATGDSLYIILGVPKTATGDDIKKSYRRSLQFIVTHNYHPFIDTSLSPCAYHYMPDPCMCCQSHVCFAVTLLTPHLSNGNYGSLGLYIAEQFGEENVNTYFVLTSGWCKAIFFCTAVFTCCYCCCCLCCCFNFCCGKCRPKHPEEDYVPDLDIGEEDDTTNLKKNEWGETETEQTNASTITSQPQAPVDPWADKQSIPIAMPAPTAGGDPWAATETTGLKDTHHSSYMSS